jgi:hypothetical protein
MDRIAPVLPRPIAVIAVELVWCVVIGAGVLAARIAGPSSPAAIATWTYVLVGLGLTAAPLVLIVQASLSSQLIRQHPGEQLLMVGLNGLFYWLAWATIWLAALMTPTPHPSIAWEAPYVLWLGPSLGIVGAELLAWRARRLCRVPGSA